MSDAPFDPADRDFLLRLARGEPIPPAEDDRALSPLQRQLASAYRDANGHGDINTLAAALREVGGHADIEQQLRALLARTPARGERAEDWPEPEDRGSAVLSPNGEIEYVADLLKPGRIVVVAAEEGSGKSFAITGELAIRLATAGGSFAGTWPIVRTGPVLCLSEMHPDDDFQREETILQALELNRSAFNGRYWRLPLMTAAGGEPALNVAAWRSWITTWTREHGVLAAIFDTATGATQVDPWGKDIQAVFRNLRVMLDEYPDLAIVLIVHCKKPTGKGERHISDVIGEWARWCDVVLMLERDGPTRVRLSSLKRVRRQRRIVATQQDGLLVEPKDLAESIGPKVRLEKVVEAVEHEPGLSMDRLAQLLGVSRPTARGYARTAENEGWITLVEGARKTLSAYPTGKSAFQVDSADLKAES